MRQSDQLFLAALKAMQSWLSSSNRGIRHPLKRQYVEVFADADAAKSRLEMIAGSINYSAQLRLPVPKSFLTNGRMNVCE